MSPEADSVRCGPYEVIAQRPGSLTVADDGTVRLYAEHSYLVRLAADAERDVLGGALSVPRGGREGQLRFGNFVGRTELGGRRLDVRSNRLSDTAAERMLDQVSGWFASLPFAASGPVGAAYSTEREQTPRVLYHSFALLRDAFRRLGPHDLRGATERILAQPHETLASSEPRLVPVGAASRVDAETIISIPRAPELLRRVQAGSALAATPTVRQLRGMLPEFVRVRPFRHTTDNPENRFVAGAVDAMIGLLRQFERLARAQSSPGKVANAREAAEIADFLRRCRRHRVLDEVRPLTEIPLHSVTLRSRPGYRELLALYGELQARAHASAPHDAERLLESRDAAAIFELWCYVKVLEALESRLGPPLSRDRVEVGDFQAELRWGYAVSWPEVTAYYNATFARAGARGHSPSFSSYSLSLRPDIALRSRDGRLNVLDAKLKRRFHRAVDAENSDPRAVDGDTFKPEDLHKMHAYRDALSADSAWILYPGSRPTPDRYPAPSVEDDADPGRHAGVGAIALRPGADHDGGLARVLAELV